MTEAEKELLSYHDWRQSITIHPSLKTPGRIKEKLWNHIGMPNNLKGKTFLDVGSNDGMFCFLAESKGARVFGSDLYKDDLSTMRDGWPIKGIHLLKEYKKSNITIHRNGIYHLHEIGTKMDTVLCSNVINWLDDIEKGIAQLCSITKGELIISDGFLLKNDTPHREPQEKLRYIYNLKYIEQLLQKNGFRLKSATKLNAYQNFIRTFAETVKLTSKQEVKLYSYPSLDASFLLTNSLNTTSSSVHDDFYFVHQQGWVHKNDVQCSSNQLSTVYRTFQAIGLEHYYCGIKENEEVKRTGIKTHKLLAVPA